MKMSMLSPTSMMIAGQSHQRHPNVRSNMVIASLTLALATIAVRAPWFGDITYHEDEGFYLVFAQAMHHGAVPYVDIWDRKPFGLFIIYWLISFLPGIGILAYQAVSGLFCFATSLVIHRIVARLHDGHGAISAGIAYLACCPALLGAGGQTPIFYNLFVSLAAMLVMPSSSHSEWPALVRRLALAMILCGIAITIKPTAIVESVYLGIFAVYRVWLHPSGKRSNTAIVIVLLAILGALPTLSIFAAFASIGSLNIYWFASFVSVSMKTPQSAEITKEAAIYLYKLLLPLWIMSAIGAIILFTRRAQNPAYPFLLGWMLAAMGGFLLVPNFWDHYAIPLLPPLTVLASVVFSRRGIGMIWAAMVLWWMIVVTGWPGSSRAHIANQQITQIARIVDRERQGGCMYLFEGAPVLYALTDACHVTSRLFPQHLSFALEKRAIGLDAFKEMQRVIERKPAVIALTAKPLVFPYNIENRQLLRRALRSGYHRVAMMPVDETNRPRYFLEIWALGQPRQAAPVHN